MADEGQDKFTVYLEGQEGHRGNVLLHSFIDKVGKLSLLLGKLERAYLEAAKRQTDFEIVDADKVNPTSLTLRAVPRVQAYNPRPAFEWSMRQFKAVAQGDEPDERIGLDIADDFVRLSTRDSGTGYKAFWINGYAEKVAFDEVFHANAARLVAQRRKALPDGPQWREGKAFGTVVGELLKLDDLEHDREFVIVPPIGAPITCVFPDQMLDQMGQFWHKVVKVEGVLHYAETSPFPTKVEAFAGGVRLYREAAPKRSLAQMRGVFAGKPRPVVEWDGLLHG